MEAPHPHPDPRWLRQVRVFLAKRVSRRRHLHGGLLHRLLGERLFDKRLWKPEKQPFAWGMALGVFIGMMPTYWVQALIAVFFAYLFRVNITAAVLGTLVTNPLTTIFIVGFQVKVGIWMIGPPEPHEIEHYRGILKTILSHGKQYLIGSFVTSLAGAVVGYAAVIAFWQAGTRVRRKRKRSAVPKPHQPPAS